MKWLMVLMVLATTSVFALDVKDFSELKSDSLKEICSYVDDNSNKRPYLWRDEYLAINIHFQHKKNNHKEVAQLLYDYGKIEVGEDSIYPVLIDSVIKLNPYGNRILDPQFGVFVEQKLNEHLAQIVSKHSLTVYEVRGTFIYIADVAHLFIDSKTHEGCLIVGGID